MKLLILKLRRFWASLQHDHQLALKICLLIKHELERLDQERKHYMALETATLKGYISAAVAKLQADAAAITDAQNAATAAQNDAAAAKAAEAAAQAELDSMSQQLAATGLTPAA